MLRIAIIGCGKIADQHVQAIHRIDGCKIVAVCDSEILMAKQLAERFAIPGIFSNVADMLGQSSIDIVHVTTPPQGHYSLAKECLEKGSHVYLEKPFTVTAKEASALIELANTSGRLITAGHNYQFTPEMCQMREITSSGFLGGRPVHVESFFSYDLGDASYVAPLLGSSNHWVRRLPGRLLHNNVSHGIAKMAEFLDDEITEIVARAAESPRMLEFGGKGVFDELRVSIRDRLGTTGYFCFSTQIRPNVNQLRLMGPKNSLLVDQGCSSLIQMRNKPHKSYLTYFIPPLENAREHFRNARHNMAAFLRRKLYQDFGRFYASVRDTRPPPIPYREIILTARIMDQIFEQIYPLPKTEETLDRQT